MHQIAPFALIPVVMASRSVILEAPDEACGYLNGIEQAPFGCNTSEKCAIYYPTSSMAAPATLLPSITRPPQPSMVCCEPPRGDCVVQPTACVDILGNCTGTCPSDPMTLKCTAGAQLICNRAHFESPLSFRSIAAVDNGLEPTDAPVDGWFCGPAATTAQHIDASHSQPVSTTHADMSPSLVSPTATLGVTITLSRSGLQLGPSVRPSTTLSVTITLSRPGQTPGPSPIPSPSADFAFEDTDCKDDTRSGQDCCFDDQEAAEPCYDEARRARLQQRQATSSSTTATPPVSAPRDVVSRGSAIVSTAHVGQTNRAPLVEATRPWNVVVPTAVATSTTTADPETRRFPREGNKNRPNIKKIILVAVLGGLGTIALAWVASRKWGHRLVSRRQQLSTQHQNGHEPAGHTEHASRRRGDYLRYAENFGSIADRGADDLDSVQFSSGHGGARERQQPGPVYTGPLDSFFRGQPGLVFGGSLGPALRSHQQVSPQSGEAADADADADVGHLEFQSQSEESLGQEARRNALGVAGSGRRNRAYNVL